jgi:hypothetical protein
MFFSVQLDAFPAGFIYTKAVSYIYIFDWNLTEMLCLSPALLPTTTPNKNQLHNILLLGLDYHNDSDDGRLRNIVVNLLNRLVLFSGLVLDCSDISYDEASQYVSVLNALLRQVLLTFRPVEVAQAFGYLQGRHVVRAQRFLFAFKCSQIHRLSILEFALLGIKAA